MEEALGMNMADEVYLYPQDREKFLKELVEKGGVASEQQLRAILESLGTP